MKVRFFARLLAAGAIASSVALTAGAASAAPTGQSPQFFQPTGVNPIRSAGSETTFYLMNQLGSLYNQTSVYGCTLSSTDNRTCVTTSDGTATDTLDDYSRDEYINGAGIGSGGGIGELCGSKVTGGLSVNFARASRSLNANECNTAVQLNYADDLVAPVTFTGVNTSLISGNTAACTTSTAALPGGTATTAYNVPCGQIGPVAAGWRPGDPLAGPYSGNAFTNMTIDANATGTSLAARIYCPTNGSPITDWGQLTDKSQPVGSGAPIGVPIYIPFVNTASGTQSFYKGVIGCDPNSKNQDKQVAQENDAPQMSDLAYGNYPGTTTANYVAQSNQVAATLYYVSYGVSQWRPYTSSVTVPQQPNAAPISGAKTSSANILNVNNVTPSTACALPNSGGCFDNANPPNAVTQIATARKLYNIVNPVTPTATLTGLTASTGGFLNWICDTDPAKANHGKDLTTGKNYADEIDYTINTQFLFPRVPCLGTTSAPVIPIVAAGATPPAGGAAITDMAH